MEQTLFEQFGGKEGISSVVKAFYDRVLADDHVNHFFANTDMEKQIRHQSLFISWALGGPNQYTGLSMEKAHEGMNLQESHFMAIAGHLGAALSDAGATQEQIGQVVEKLLTLKDAILHK
ncbi:group I truncated hemoglobin [Brevibacillus dissolubilis]|uniref:group I truncated hemoglobin n=1 Tax=Brevibacillus dissolubilis TaxID=1844116 RepID=UPI001117528B|nr:group 1 truncated hemoglobin [Brevibacillus dissolubilis]